jgi:hypothetical protein
MFCPPSGREDGVIILRSRREFNPPGCKLKLVIAMIYARFAGLALRRLRACSFWIASSSDALTGEG